MNLHEHTQLMKAAILFSFVYVTMCGTAYSQKKEPELIVSPSFYKYAGHKLGVGAELGFLPVASKSFVTLKANLSTKKNCLPDIQL